MTGQETDPRQASGYANYRGDCRGILAERPKGPNCMGELLWPVTATYDAETDRTHVGFSLQPPAGVR